MNTPEELKREFANKWQKDLHLKSYNGQIDNMLSDLNEVIREELIKYDNWITKGDSVVSSEEAVNDYIKFNTE